MRSFLAGYKQSGVPFFSSDLKQVLDIISIYMLKLRKLSKTVGFFWGGQVVAEECLISQQKSVKT